MSTFTYNPRPYVPATTSAPQDRFSTASAAPLSAIGNMLASAYDTDDSDVDDNIHTPSDSGAPPSILVSPSNKGDRRLTQTRKVPPKYLRSVTGEVELAYGQASPQAGGQARTPPRGGRVDADGQKRVTIIDFPSPSISPAAHGSYGHPAVHPYQPSTPERPARAYNPHTSPSQHQSPGGPAYPSPARPGLRSPGGPPPPSHHHQNRPHLQLLTQTAALHGLPGPREIQLPPPASPISPLLAATPSSHPSPIPRFMGAAGGNRDSTASGISTNESIAGFDTMKEKRALFRGGEEELIAFSPRIRKMGRGPGAANRGTWFQNRRTSMGGAGGEFWKRFSTMEGMKAGKESEWLSEHNDGWRSIKKWIIIGIIMLLLAVGGGVTAAILLTQKKTA